MITKLKRRMRCEVQGCKDFAEFGMGIKGNDYPVCRKHFMELAEDINKILEAEKPAVVEEVVEAPEEFFECKYCHEKFSKKEMTVSEFAQHSKACKKLHAEEK